MLITLQKTSHNLAGLANMATGISERNIGDERSYTPIVILIKAK